MKKLFFIISIAAFAVIFINRAECTVFDAGLMNYKILRVDQNLIRIRFHHSFIALNNDICNAGCNKSFDAEDTILSDITFLNETKKIKISGDIECAYNIIDAGDIAYGIRETDIVFPNIDDLSVTFLYSDCCSIATHTYTYNKVNLQTEFKLVILENDEVNQPPDTKDVELYKTFLNGRNNQYQLNITDENDHVIQCKWIDATFDRKNFILSSDCLLSLTASVTLGTYSIGISVSDYDKNDTKFENPLSTVPVFILVNVVVPSQAVSKIEQCENPNKKPISILNNFNLTDYTTTTTTTTTSSVKTSTNTPSSSNNIQYITSTFFITFISFFWIIA